MAEAEESAPEIDLTHYLQVLSRRRWIIVSVLVVAVLSAALYVYTARPVYSATTLILIEKERRSQAFAEGMMIEATADDYYQTQYKLLKSRSLLRKVHEDLSLGKIDDFAEGPAALDRAVDVAPIRRSRLVNVSVESYDPKLAARIANNLAETYVADNIESKLFISREILGTLFPDQVAGSVKKTISHDSLPAVVNSKLIQQLKGIQANLEAKEGDLSRRYTKEHPELLRLKSQMAAVDSRIKNETTKIVEGLRAELSGRLLGNNVRIIDPAEAPTAPAKPRKTRTLVIAALLGLMSGYLLALGIDALDQSLHTQDDIERKLKLPFLGSVPMAIVDDDDSSSYRKLVTGPKSYTGEALKNIRTMIGFAAAGKEMKSILITSTGQSEGKTFIAISLAMVFSQLGEKVLLIEGDLRRPNLHKRFGLSRERGLSHFLAHAEGAGEIEELVQRTEDEKLDVLVCGHIPPNPSELLSTPRVEALIRWAKDRYDRVLIDGTPIFPITDALLWGNYVDAAAFVVKFGATNSNLAVRARQKLKEAQLKVAGAVVNQVTAKAHSYGDYYYYYYYHHSDYTKASKEELEQARKA
ncbi:polysaccharide biosynthesis tyrosine autokinase [Elusimicrobiota bacterium]